tara:strand:+ start:199 stop:696 length:498 start_codon:yes stop_codon:yes gene_type:complete
MLGDNTMKITKARLKQIIKEEMDNLDLDEVRISPEDDAAIEAHAGKTCDEVHPDMTHPEYMKKKLDEAEKQSKMGDQGPGKLQQMFNPPGEGKGNTEEEYKATGREKKSASAVDSGGKLGQEEFKNMLISLLKSKNVMPADRKAVLSSLFGAAGAKIHTALLAEK